MFHFYLATIHAGTRFIDEQATARPAYEISALNAQPAGDVGDGLQRRAYQSVLDVADVATAVDRCSYLLLGQTESDTMVTDPFTKARRHL